MNLDPYARMIERLSGRVDTKPVFRWATVTQTQPLLIQLDGDPAPLLGSPSNAGPKVYLVGERVRVELQNGRATVRSAANRVEDLRGTTAQRIALAISGAAVQGMRFYDTDENREYVWLGTEWGTPPNRVLWEGAVYMQAGQTATLTESVTEQNTGIVLVWSAYASGAGQNYDWAHTYIAKDQVLHASGAGVNCVAYSGNTLIRKYLYVRDTYVEGNAVNATAPNNALVLRRILGV